MTLTLCTPWPALAEPGKPIPLWPGDAPGEKGDIGEENDTTKIEASSGKPIIIRAKVSKPTITLYKPPADKDTGAAVIVCPGGGYNILAWDLEGTEVCEWLNSFGVTGVVLKYRVPSRKGLEKYTAALQDAQRAIGMVRANAKEWGIDPKRIGILGFSAGGHLAASASNNYETRTYPAVDDADKQSCRPDFSVLIYPAYLAAKDDLSKMAPDLKITNNTPPAFIAMTLDDGVKVENAFTYALACKAAKVQCEVHVYPTGGHGYGLRGPSNAGTHWPISAAEWMKAQGLLKPKN